MNITNLSELQTFLGSLPEGTTCDILASDLEAGNFEDAVFVEPSTGHGTTMRFLYYTGPVVEGYVSPFEQPVEADL